MKTSAQIIVVEPSYILYEGLVQFLSKSEISFRSKHADNLGKAERFLCAKPDCLIIMNPGFIQYNIRDFQQLKNKWPRARWMALVYSHFDRQVLSLFDGHLGLNDSPSALISSIKTVLSGKASQMKNRTKAALSGRETEVLKLLALGLTNKEIANKLSISVNTVFTHRRNISQKTGISSVSGLTIYSVINNLIPLENTNE